jgi:hypothetical protein
MFRGEKPASPNLPENLKPALFPETATQIAAESSALDNAFQRALNGEYVTIPIEDGSSTYAIR